MHPEPTLCPAVGVIHPFWLILPSTLGAVCLSVRFQSQGDSYHSAVCGKHQLSTTASDRDVCLRCGNHRHLTYRPSSDGFARGYYHTLTSQIKEGSLLHTLVAVYLVQPPVMVSGIHCDLGMTRLGQQKTTVIRWHPKSIIPLFLKSQKCEVRNERSNLKCCTWSRHRSMSSLALGSQTQKDPEFRAYLGYIQSKKL